MNFQRKMFERTAFFQTITRHLQVHNLIYICGYAGSGKTVAIEKWLSMQKGRTALVSAQTLISDANAFSNCAYIVLDDLQDVTQEDDQKQVLKILTAANNTRYLLISRAVLPSYLRPFQATGQMLVMENQMELNIDAVENYVVEELSTCTADLVAFVYQYTKGYVLAVDCMVEWLKKGHACNRDLVEKVENEIFDYFEQLVFCYFTPEEQNFVLKMAHFPEFTLRMAELMSGMNQIAYLLKHISQRSQCFALIGQHRYYIYDLFQRFLLQYQAKFCTKSFIDHAWGNAGLYYELEDDLVKAIYCYDQVKNTEKIKELLIRHTKRPPYQSYYVELRQYYFALSQEEVEQSPDLMAAMSMIYSMIEQADESEYWYGRLKQYEKNARKEDVMGKKAAERLAFLDIALPHRGVKNLLGIMLRLYRVRGNHQSIGCISTTSGMPSIVHGGKDLCLWTKHDQTIYQLFRKPMESLLGINGVGVADAALAESLLEKTCGENTTDIVFHATAAMNATEHLSSLDVYFVSMVILLRLSVMRNNLSSAHRMLDVLQSKWNNQPNERIKGNAEALRVRLWMMEGETKQVGQWLNKVMQTNYQPFNHIQRYQYLTHVRCLLLRGNELEAITLLMRLLPSFEKKQQVYHWIEAHLLLAIAQYRMKEPVWMDTLEKATIKLEKIGFYRLPAEEGAALLPLLREAKYHQANVFRKKMIAEVKQYAKMYPLYLQKAPSNQFLLTNGQKQVLSLVGKGFSNDQIAQIMDVSLRTVKFHTSNIYAKLGVKGRAQAMAMAQLMVNDSME